MNDRVFKKMTENQRAFWNYKYNKQRPKIGIFMLVLFWSALSMSILLAFVYGKEYLPGYTDVHMALRLMGLVSSFAIWVWIIDVLYNFIEYFVWLYFERKWLKKEGLL